MACPNGRDTSSLSQDLPLQAMLGAASTGLALVDLAGTTTLVNRALCQMLGCCEAELVGRRFLDLVHPADRDSHMRPLEQALLGACDVFRLEARLLHRDGHIVRGEVSGSLARDDAGVPRSAVCQIVEITGPHAAGMAETTVQDEGHQILERISDGFIASDRDWRITQVNAAAERMLRRTRDELLGCDAWEVFAPAVETPAFDAAQQAMHGGTASCVEVFYPTLQAWFDVQLYPAPNGVSAFFRDVTERHRLIEELRVSETRFRALVEQLPAAVYLLDADDQMTPVFASPYLQALSGYPPDEVLDSARWLSFVHPDDRDRAAAEDAKIIKTHEAFRLDYRFVRNDGDIVWVRDECVPMRDAAGAITGWLGIIIDVTDRVAAGEARARLAAIVESAEDAIISSTLDGTISSWNRGAERLYGYQAEEVLGRPFTVLLPEGWNDPLLDGRMAAARAGEPVPPYETVRRRRDGSTVDVTISHSPIRDGAGAVVGLSSISRDISERKRAEAELEAALAAAEAANEAKSAFLAMMSHELRTPLQAILGYAEFLLANPASALLPEEREDLGYIHQGGQRMLHLITQLLDLSRIEAGRLELVRKPVDVQGLLEQVRQDVAPQAAQKGLVLRLDLPDELPVVLGDLERLRQILLNLVGNAVKFTERGSVGIRVAITGDELVIAVHDTGTGIAPDELPHIFERFRQADSRLARRHGGAGLGLAIAQKLAGLMDGRITVASEPGAGSTFALHLPLP